MECSYLGYNSEYLKINWNITTFMFLLSITMLYLSQLW